jgi:hypothetical protein
MEATRVVVSTCIVAWNAASHIERDGVPAYRGESKRTYTAEAIDTRFTKGVHLRANIEREVKDDALFTPRFTPEAVPVGLRTMEVAMRDMKTLLSVAWPDDITEVTLGQQAFEIVRRLALEGIVLHHQRRGHETITNRTAMIAVLDGTFEGLRQILIERPEDD